MVFWVGSKVGTLPPCWDLGLGTPWEPAPTWQGQNISSHGRHVVHASLQFYNKSRDGKLLEYECNKNTKSIHKQLATHNIVQFHNNVLWEWQYSTKYCQSHRTLLWIWIMLCSVTFSGYNSLLFIVLSNRFLVGNWKIISTHQGMCLLGYLYAIIRQGLNP